MLRLHLTVFPLAFGRVSALGALVCIAGLTGCNDTKESVALPLPTDPTTSTPLTPAQSLTGSIAGFVIDKSEQCIMGARVQMIDGPRAGEVFVQNVCGFWDYGEDLGFSFHGLPSGTPVTVRATADGYTPANISATPSNPFSYTTMIVLAQKQ